MLHPEDEEFFFFLLFTLKHWFHQSYIWSFRVFVISHARFRDFRQNVPNPATMQIWSLKHEKFPKFSEDFACLWRNNSFCEKWIGVIQLEKCQVFDMKKNGSLWRIRGQFWWSLVNSLFFSHILLNHSLLVAKGPTFVLITSDFKRLPFKN